MQMVDKHLGGDTHDQKRSLQIKRYHVRKIRKERKGRNPIIKKIRVVDAQGNDYGATYARRAKGLAKKGRARFIGNNTLMLACPPKNLEDTMNDILNINNQNEPATNGSRTIPFEPRKWRVDLLGNNKSSHCAERIIVTDMIGGMTEVLSLGSWSHEWAYVRSPHFMLKKNTDYVFTFWHNGGENQNNSELCQFRAYPVQDELNPLVFKLNRNYIKETKYNSGWYRYDIPFNTGGGDGNNEIEVIAMEFQFISMYAHSAFMPNRSEFDALPDDERPDPRIPQRHNIFFADGYPRDSHWSHLVYGESTTGQHLHMQQRIGGRSSLTELANSGVCIETILSDMDAGDKFELLRNANLEELANAGVDIEEILSDMDSADKLELLRNFK